MLNAANRKHVLGIIGSPRRGGNTEILVDEVLLGAQQAGADVEKVSLNKINIKPCRACEACKKTGTCVQQDDLPGLMDRLQNSQVWVLGTPVYLWGPSAQLKAFVDRFYGIRNVVKGRRIILTIPMEDSNPKTARYTVGMLKEALDYLKVEVFATVLAPGVLDPGDIHNHPEVLTAAHRAGQKAIMKMKNK